MPESHTAVFSREGESIALYDPIPEELAHMERVLRIWDATRQAEKISTIAVWLDRLREERWGKCHYLAHSDIIKKHMIALAGERQPLFTVAPSRNLRMFYLQLKQAADAKDESALATLEVASGCIWLLRLGPLLPLFSAAIGAICAEVSGKELGVDASTLHSKYARAERDCVEIFPIDFQPFVGAFWEGLPLRLVTGPEVQARYHAADTLYSLEDARWIAEDLLSRTAVFQSEHCTILVIHNNDPLSASAWAAAAEAVNLPSHGERTKVLSRALTGSAQHFHDKKREDTLLFGATLGVSNREIARHWVRHGILDSAAADAEESARVLVRRLRNRLLKENMMGEADNLAEGGTSTE